MSIEPAQHLIVGIYAAPFVFAQARYQPRVGACPFGDSGLRPINMSGVTFEERDEVFVFHAVIMEIFHLPSMVIIHFFETDNFHYSPLVRAGSLVHF
jgi:hypothetical protein